MNDPYAVLGLKPDATDKEVKRAYKKLSMKHHPDRGGDAERFKEINQAYETIINGGVGPDNQHAKSITELMALFSDVIRECYTMQPHKVDLTQRARNKIIEALIDVDRIKKQCIADREIFEKLQGRMSTTNTDNAFEMLIEARFKEYDRRIEVCEHDTDNLNAMLETLGNYHFDMESGEEPTMINLPPGMRRLVIERNFEWE